MHTLKFIKVNVYQRNCVIVEKYLSRDSAFVPDLYDIKS